MTDTVREAVARAIWRATWEDPEPTPDQLPMDQLGPATADWNDNKSTYLLYADAALSALRDAGALVESKLAADIGNAFMGFPKCHMFVRYKSNGMGEPNDEGSYYAIKLQDKGPSINFGMTELGLELFANDALSKIEAARATTQGEG